MSLKLVRLDESNIDDALQTAKQIFPEEMDEITDYYRGIFSTGTGLDWVTWNETYLAYLDDQCVGLTGLYRIVGLDSDLWLDWFGVIPAVRGQSVGKKSLIQTIEKAKKLNKPTLRLWSPEYLLDGTGLKQFYERAGFFCEPYKKSRGDNAISIFSLSLNEKPLDKWNDPAKERPNKIF